MNIRIVTNVLLPALLSGFLISSCSGLRKLEEGQYLLNKSTIKSNLKGHDDDMRAILKQKPNRKILGVFRFHLGIYNLANQGKDTTRFKEWIKRTIGEAPVILDSTLTQRSADQLEIYMNNHGFFNAEVSDTTIYKKNHKANVIYTINSSNPYTVKAIKYRINDEQLSRIIYNDSVNCLIKPGHNYDSGNLQEERNRISNLLKNKGYYFFSPLYITYAVDSALQSDQVIIYMQVADPSPANDSIAVHKPYHVSKVIVQTDYDPILLRQTSGDTSIVKGYYFITASGQQQYTPRLLLQHIFISQGDLFRLDNLERTYKSIQDLGVFKFINIKYEKALYGDSLDCYILLTPAPRQDYKLEAEGTNTGGNLGIAGNVSYRNKNIFRGSEQFEFKLKGGLEAQREIADTTEANTNLALFNTYEIGPEISLAVPRILFPGLRNVKVTNPITNFTTSFNYQQRPEFERTLANLSYSYSWRETPRKRHYIFPAEINFVKVSLQPAFRKILVDLQDPALLRSFEDQLITNGRYSFVYNSQELGKLRNYIFFKATVEYAGNTIWLARTLSDMETQEGQSVQLFDVPYAQYLRPDFSFSFYQVFSPNTQLVYHLAAGLGFAYGNSQLMPFEKSFYAGGSNDLRAWRARTLGPGIYPNQEIFDKNGDVKINANVEYRFDIFRKLEGALFADAGNIWLVKNDERRPGGFFIPEKTAEQLALGTGVGLRLDFTFFILRFDWGIKLKDPSLPKSEQWLIKEMSTKNSVLNFGIGYPF